MKIVKIKASDYKNPASMLRRVGAVLENQAFPDRVYWCKADLQKMEKAILSTYKNIYKDLNNDRLKYHIAMDMLNYGPSLITGKNFPQGYMLVDDNFLRHVDAYYTREEMEPEV